MFHSIVHQQFLTFPWANSGVKNPAPPNDPNDQNEHPIFQDIFWGGEVQESFCYAPVFLIKMGM